MGRGLDIPWVVGGQYTMGRVCQYTMGRGSIYHEKGVDIPCVGGLVNIPLVWGSIYHG